MVKIGIVQGLHGGLGSASGYLLTGKTAAALASARSADWSFAADSWINYYLCGALKAAWIVLPYPVPPSFQSPSTIGYLPEQSGVLKYLRNLRFLHYLRVLNRRRIWMRMQVGMRVQEHDPS